MKKLSKKAKILISAIVAVVVIAAVVVTLFLTGVFGGGKLGSLSTEKYEVVGIDFVSMTQKGIHTYDLDVTLEEKFAAKENLNIYFSKNDTFDKEKSDLLVYEKKENNIFGIKGVTYEPGDYFLYVEADGEVGTYPITVPKMAPKTWMNGDIVNIEMEVDGNTSWSSFIDPEGKNVYRSASPVFDETAKAMEENIDILTSSYSDKNATKAEPYYYLVFNGKNGKFRYISAPLFYQATQGPVTLNMYAKDDKPYLEIEGNLYAISEDAERVMQLRAGNFDGDDPTSTFMVDNSYKGGDKTAFKFVVPMDELKKASNNLCIFLTENGTMCEWSINAQGIDLSKYSVKAGNATYGLTDENALKITKLVDAYDDIKVDLGTSGKKAVLKVEGTLKYGIGGEDYQLILAVSDGQQYVAENKVNEGKRFSFEFPLKQLYSKGVWYDIQVKCVNEIAYYDIPATVADMDDAVIVGENKYNFEEYGGLLKINYTIVKDFKGLTAKLNSVNGRPMLTVTGTIDKTKADNLSLAIRTGDTVIKQANSAKTDGSFQASVDLSQMEKKNEWYDVLIYYEDDDAYYDLSVSNANMDQKLTVGKEEYTFQNWEEQLKVQRADAPVTITNQKAVITKSGKDAYLIVTGKTTENAADYKMALRNEDNIITTVSNNAKGNNIKFTIRLSVIPKSGTWYDIIVGHAEFNDSTDISSDAADMETKVEAGKHVYKFADWEGQLKVYYDKALTDIKGVKAEIKKAGKKPYLIVKGKMSNAANRYLGIRTEDKVMKVYNQGKDNNIYFKFDLTKLSKAETWYDVIIGTKGSDEYRDLTVAAADMEQTLTVGKRVYSFQNWERALKITYIKAAEDLKGVKASIQSKNGKPVLTITGKMKNASQMYLGIRTEDKIKRAANKGKGNRLNFTFDLTKLSSAGVWYDVIIGDKTFKTYKDVTVSSADMTESVAYRNKTYKFAEWNRALKVYFEDDTATGLAKGQSIDEIKAVLILKNRKPFLRVQGTMKGIDNGNLSLGIRTEDKVKKVGNLTDTSGRFLFDFDLTKLDKSGLWYDVVLMEKKSGAYVDVKTKSVYSMDISVSYQDNVYRFADWEGDLKVYYTNTAEEEAARAKVAANFKNVNAKITSSGGKPVLNVTADIGSLKNTDVTLNVRSGDKTIQVKNQSGTSGKFAGIVDLTKLTEKGTWYDVYWFVDSKNTEINLSSTQADMSSDYTYKGYKYQFKEWNSQLKVEFE